METKTDIDTILANMGDTITISSPSGAKYSNTVISNGTYTVGTGLYTAAQTVNPWFTNNPSPKIKLDGEGADIVVNGYSLVEAINHIQQRLNCLQVNPELEAEWDQLKALGDQYRELEQHILDKQSTWDKLKAMPPPDIG